MPNEVNLQKSGFSTLGLLFIAHWRAGTYLLLRCRDILRALGLATEHTLRPVTAQEFDRVESTALGRHENGAVDAVPRAPLGDQRGGLVRGPCGEIRLSRGPTGESSTRVGGRTGKGRKNK